MSVLLQGEKLSKHYGFQRVLEDVSFNINEGQKIGVIGRNGAGKSTLFKLIVDQETPDAGRVIHHPGLRLGYVEQDDLFEPGESVIAYLERLSGKPIWTCAKLAGRFDLKHGLLETAVETLSGGYQMRVKLTRMLLAEPNLLLLDEPTNYLDLRTLLLLERFLQTFQGSTLVISHDREFLKRTCEHTMEIERGQLTFYPGPLEEFLAYKAQQVETLQSYNRSVEAQQKHLQTFIDRFRYKASKATQAQSKIKQLARLSTIGIDLPLSNARIRIPQIEEVKGIVLRVVDLAIGYPERIVAKELTFELNRGEHIAILGDNGQGKTTLLKTLAGSLPPREGNFRWSPSATIGYYAQHLHEQLAPQDTVENYLTRLGGGISREDILRMAGNFLFKEDDLGKTIRVLSGGERARLCLAGLLLGRFRVLLLDEPTNHLDVETVEALGRALKEYAGTILFVSHDRTFVNLLATNIIEVQNGTARRYPYTYEEYVYHLAQEITPEHEQETATTKETEEGPQPRTKQEVHRSIEQYKRHAQQLEKDMKALEAERQVVLKYFLDHPTDYAPAEQKRLHSLETRMAHNEHEWLKTQETIELETMELRSWK